ncbi:sugar phosphate isomerase/epimerase family protein [Chloroflexota bacterium]
MSKLGFFCHRMKHFQGAVLDNGLQRTEIYNLLPEEIPLLNEEIRRSGVSMSIHVPLVKPDWYPHPPTICYLCDADRDKQDLSLRMVEETLKQAGDYDTEYVVVHHPHPLEEPDGTEYAELRKIALDSAYHLSKLSDKYKQEIHIEGYGPNPLLRLDFLKEVFSTFPNLKFCFDTGHLNVDSKKRGLDFYEFANGLAEHIGSIHLWNYSDSGDYKNFMHVPVHPSQLPKDGWVDVELILKTLWGHVKAVIFENVPRYPKELGGYDYRDGVQWVKQMVTTLS